MPLLKSSYLATSRLLKATPDPVLEPFVRAGGGAWFTLSRGQHRAALDNYAAVLELPRNHADVRSTARRAFFNYGRMLVDFCRIASLTRDEVNSRCLLTGTDGFDRALEQGRGIVLAVPHMGSWDMAGASVAVNGYDIHAVAATFPGSLNDAMIEGRQFFGMKVIPLGRGAVPAVNAVLERNGMIALVSDIAHGGGVDVEMFGRRTNMVAGPASFALRTGAALIPASVWSTGPSSYHAHAEPPIEFEATGERRADIAALTQKLALVFERLIRAHPTDWYAFKPILRPA
ncbi:MAG TPA: hypothetical protein VF137_07005 [Candidatus Dormibacteraeota bacterium]